jgi:hypothetical protein
MGVTLLGILLVGLVVVYPYAKTFTSLPRLTHTASGVAGDPINLILVGSAAQLTQGFRQAGWLVPDPITPQTSARIAAASLAHQSYPTAPISTLYVFGRPQDLAFEKPTNDVQNRGHIRLWLTGTRLDNEPVWAAQASYDHGIELSASTELPTHHIAPAVDLERHVVGVDLERTGLVKVEALTAFASPVLYARNGGGDFYESDGNALIINFTRVTVPLQPPAWVIAGLKTQVFLLYDGLVSGQPWALTSLALYTALVSGVIVSWLVRRMRSKMLRHGTPPRR